MREQKSRMGDRNHYRPGSRRVVHPDLQVAIQATVIQGLRRMLGEYRLKQKGGE